MVWKLCLGRHTISEMVNNSKAKKNRRLGSQEHAYVLSILSS
jgi:hypothetical protein